jgi:hypothetical protein
MRNPQADTDAEVRKTVESIRWHGFLAKFKEQRVWAV